MRLQSKDIENKMTILSADFTDQSDIYENDFDFEEIVGKAIKDERRGHRFYTNLSKDMTNEHSKRAFQLLATEELDHLETLERYLNKGPDAFKLKKVEHKNELIFDNIIIDQDAGLKDVLIFAINEENDAIEQYKALARFSQNKPTHDLFMQLAQFELSHLIRLEKIYRTNYNY
jgi:rubrerythrin